MYDYQGRSYLHIPQDVGVNLRSSVPPEKCYLPKKQIHVWSGHTKVRRLSVPTIKHKGKPVWNFSFRSGKSGQDRSLKFRVNVRLALQSPPWIGHPVVFKAIQVAYDVSFVGQCPSSTLLLVPSPTAFCAICLLLAPHSE